MAGAVSSGSECPSLGGGEGVSVVTEGFTRGILAEGGGIKQGGDRSPLVGGPTLALEVPDPEV